MWLSSQELQVPILQLMVYQCGTHHTQADQALVIAEVFKGDTQTMINFSYGTWNLDDQKISGEA
jgi:hypothetical protein